jgi:hypothetical protein
MNARDINSILLVDSVYSLLLYLVAVEEQEGRTVFIFSDGIPKKIRDHFDNVIYFPRGWKGLINLLHAFMVNKSMRDMILNRKNYKKYGHDHLFFSFPFIHDFTLIEDGLSNYAISRRKFPTSLLIPNVLPGSNSHVNKVILSGFKDIPKDIKHKVSLISLKECWDNRDSAFKSRVNRIFKFNQNEVENIDAILFTQPLSEDGFITEMKKIDIYRDVISMFPKIRIGIKPHPREKTDYKIHFPFATVFNGTYPGELIYLNGNGINIVITLFSTAIFTFSNCKKIVIGTEVYPELSEKVGLYKREYTD